MLERDRITAIELADGQRRVRRLDTDSACALAWLMLIMGNGLASGYFPALGRDFVPSAFVVAYSAAAGALGAWIEARGRESEIA